MSTLKIGARRTAARVPAARDTGRRKLLDTLVFEKMLGIADFDRYERLML